MFPHIHSKNCLGLFNSTCHYFLCYFSCDLTALIFYVDVICNTKSYLNFNRVWQADFIIHNLDLILKYKRSHYLVWECSWRLLICRAHVSGFRQFHIFLGHETCITGRILIHITEVVLNTCIDYLIFNWMINFISSLNKCQWKFLR